MLCRAGTSGFEVWGLEVQVFSVFRGLGLKVFIIGGRNLDSCSLIEFSAGLSKGSIIRVWALGFSFNWELGIYEIQKCWHCRCLKGIASQTI